MGTTFSPVLNSAIGKAMRRLVPFLMFMYILAFLDRANVGFAKQAFQADTGVSDAAFALGAGIFFVGYALFEIPSNLILHRIGAKVWMARIMITWGIISAATMFVHTETQFICMRFLLGLAESGFFPGVILYLTYWFPERTRCRATGIFYFGVPLAFVFGSPLSGMLLDLNGSFGLKGWQLMFLVEGLMATLVGIWAFFYLNNKPADAQWLSADEKKALGDAIAAEEAYKHTHGPRDVLGALRDPRVLYLVAIYFCIQMSVYGVIFYLPTQVAQLLGTKVGFKVGLVTAIPWICSALACYLVPRFSDKTGERRRVAAVTLFISGIGIAISAVAGPGIALVALCFAAAGFIAVQPVFWTLTTGYLGGTAAAGGIALIGALGNLGGLVAPNVKTWVEASLHSHTAGLFFLAGTAVVGSLLIVGVAAIGIRAVVSRESHQSVSAAEAASEIQ